MRRLYAMTLYWLLSFRQYNNDNLEVTNQKLLTKGHAHTDIPLQARKFIYHRVSLDIIMVAQCYNEVLFCTIQYWISCTYLAIYKLGNISQLDG